MIRLAVRVERARADEVLAELLELAPAGLEERDLPDGRVEFALYGAPGELPELGTLQAAGAGGPVEVTSETVGEDWQEGWRRFHPAVDAGSGARRIRVRPPWEPRHPEPAVLDVEVEPGQAFGTGSHHTTRLCLDLLTFLEPGGQLADWGCGSGVLAVAAAKLGFDPVTAVDNDPAAVIAARECAARNGVAVVCERADLRREPGPWAPTVTANLVSPLLIEVAARLERPPGRLIASGILIDEADAVAAAFAERGLVETERRASGEWIALLLAPGRG